MTNWNEIAKARHEAMVAKGFHENYSHTDLLLRGIQEVGEAASAWRKNRRANMSQFYMAFHGEDKANFAAIYEKCIKGRIEEELADIALIILDFAATNGYQIISTMTIEEDDIACILMNISECITTLRKEMEWSGGLDVYAVFDNIKEVFSTLEKLAKDFSIDLEEQVKLKMQYNLTRPYRHGDVSQKTETPYWKAVEEARFHSGQDLDQE